MIVLATISTALTSAKKLAVTFEVLLVVLHAPEDVWLPDWEIIRCNRCAKNVTLMNIVHQMNSVSPRDRILVEMEVIV